MLGRLSERMNIAGTPWMETWQNARPISVSQQSRLFNETKEAETVKILLKSSFIKFFYF